MRISDWSSDVCSSVLAPLFADMPVHVVVAGPDDARHRTLLDGAADTLAGHQFSKTLRQGKPEAVIADVVAATPGAILLVEDEDMVRTVAERALSRQGYKVLTATDGEEALEVLARGESVDQMIYRQEEHTSERQSLMLIKYTVFSLTKK